MRDAVEYVRSKSFELVRESNFKSGKTTWLGRSAPSFGALSVDVRLTRSSRERALCVSLRCSPTRACALRECAAHAPLPFDNRISTTHPRTRGRSRVESPGSQPSELIRKGRRSCGDEHRLRTGNRFGDGCFGGDNRRSPAAPVAHATIRADPCRRPFNRPLPTSPAQTTATGQERKMHVYEQS